MDSTAAQELGQEGFPSGTNPRRRTPPTPLPGECDGFEQFWSVYPRKVSKQKTARAWGKIKPIEIPLILASVETWSKTEQWHREGGRFIPYPTTFLNERRWS